MKEYIQHALAEHMKRIGAYASQKALIASDGPPQAIQIVSPDETYGREGPFTPLKLLHWPWRNASSSGTSGIPLVFRQPVSAVQREQAFLDFAWEKAGFRHTARLAVMRGTRLSQHTRLIANRLMISMSGWSDVEVMAKHRALGEFRPATIACYPSILERFLLTCARLELPHLPTVSLVLAGSEACSPQQMDLFRDALGARTVSWYGQSEQVALSFLQEDGAHEFFPGYSDVAFLPRGEMFEVCGRSLLNPTFGGQRFYRTGDLCEEPFVRFSSFFGTEVITTEKLLGRASEVITSHEGQQFPLNNIIFGLHGTEWRGLERYCVVHTRPGEFVFLYVQSDADAALRVIRALSDRVPDGFSFEARPYPEISDMEPAKWRYLMRDWSKLPPTARPQD
ncbi:MAG TPA: hypothetical protein DF715_15640 [Oceanicaulis sp.]|nr:hypothetical protein [Oceanicaulis sp.]